MRCLILQILTVIACLLTGHDLRAQNGPTPSIDVASFGKSLQGKLSEGKTDEATAHFRKTLAQAKTAEEKKKLREGYLREMARASKPLEAYRAFPGGKESFAFLAEQLVVFGKESALAELIREHETFFDDDPHLQIHRGQLAFAKKDYGRADEAWTAAFKEIRDEFVRGQYHRRWVRARALSGKTVELLDIVPAADSFRVAADLFLENRENEKLEKLIEAFSGRDKTLYSTLTYRMRLNEKADAATLLKIGENWFHESCLFIPRSTKSRGGSVSCFAGCKSGILDAYHPANERRRHAQPARIDRCPSKGTC
jgi:hypothetical protein